MGCPIKQFVIHCPIFGNLLHKLFLRNEAILNQEVCKIND